MASGKYLFAVLLASASFGSQSQSAVTDKSSGQSSCASKARTYDREELDAKFDAAEKIQDARASAAAAKLDAAEKIHESRMSSSTARIEAMMAQVATSQKNVDWWLSFLAILLSVLTLVVGVAAVAIPIVFTRNLRKEYEKAVAEVRDATLEVRKHVEIAKSGVSEISSAAEAVRQMNASEPRTSADKSAIEKAIADPSVGKSEKLRARVLSLFSREEWTEAVKLADEYVREFPGDPSGQLDAGFVRMRIAATALPEIRTKLVREALEHYRRATELNPSYSMAYSNIAWALSELAKAETEQIKRRIQYEEAVKASKKATELDKANFFGWNNLGSDLINCATIEPDQEKARDLLKDAEAALAMARRIQPEDPLLVGNLRRLEQLQRAMS